MRAHCVRGVRAAVDGTRDLRLRRLSFSRLKSAGTHAGRFRDSAFDSDDSRSGDFVPGQP